MKKTYLFSSLFCGLLAHGQVTLTHLGSYATGIFADGGTEISAYDAATQRAFSTNGSANSLDIIDISNPASPTLVTSVSMSAYGGGVNSVACKNGIVALAVEANVKQNDGKVVFFDTQGTFQAEVTVGALPDMLTFSPDGLWVVTANEGEPSDDYTVDPNGSVSLIDISGGLASLSQSNVYTIDFTGVTIPSGVRVYGNNGASSAAQDLEPEYVVVSPDNNTVYVALQENNALGVIDVASKTVTSVIALGFKDHSVVPLDASDRRNIVEMATYANVYGMYLPDAMTAYEVGGQLYLVTANEGDTRDYDGYSEEERVKNLTLDPTAFPNATTLLEDTVLGRLTVTTSLGDTDNDGDYDELYVPGGRSFSIWNASTGALVYDSGDDLEVRVFAADPDNFNSDNEDNTSFKNRSDNKGPEPEAVEVAELGGQWYAFVGLERQGGIMVYNITNPLAPVFETYVNNRNFSVSETDPACGDLGPEDILYIPASASPNGLPMLSVANEVSGTLSFFSIQAPGVGVEETAGQKELSAFPNPVSGDLLRLSESVEAEVMDLQGRTVLRSSGQEVNVSSLGAGVYYLRTKDGRVIRLVRL